MGDSLREGVSAECAVAGAFEHGRSEGGEGDAQDTGSGGGANG